MPDSNRPPRSRPGLRQRRPERPGCGAPGNTRRPRQRSLPTVAAKGPLPARTVTARFIPRAAPKRRALRTRVSVRLGGHSPLLLLTRAQGAQLLQGAAWAPGRASGAGVRRPGTPLRLCPHSPLRQRGGTDRPPREAVPHRCRARRAETRSWGRWGSCRAPLQNPPLPTAAARAHLRLRVWGVSSFAQK